MELSEAIAAEQPTPYPCKYARLLAAVDPDDATALDQLDARPASRALRAAGMPVSDSTIIRHRDGSCSCG